MTITCCRNCPLFVETLGSMLTDVLSRTSLRGGECGYHSADDSLARGPVAGATGPEAQGARKKVSERLRILDGSVVPSACPLRSGDIVLTLGKN